MNCFKKNCQRLTAALCLLVVLSIALLSGCAELPDATDPAATTATTARADATEQTAETPDETAPSAETSATTTETPATTTAAPTTTTTTVAPTTVAPTTTGKKPTTATPAPKTKPTAAPSTVAPHGRTVYITPTGKCYHYSADCAGKNAMARNLSDVTGSYRPCKKCT